MRDVRGTHGQRFTGYAHTSYINCSARPIPRGVQPAGADDGCADVGAVCVGFLRVGVRDVGARSRVAAPRSRATPRAANAPLTANARRGSCVCGTRRLREDRMRTRHTNAGQCRIRRVKEAYSARYFCFAPHTLHPALVPPMQRAQSSLRVGACFIAMPEYALWDSHEQRKARDGILLARCIVPEGDWGERELRAGLVRRQMGVCGMVVDGIGGGRGRRAMDGSAGRDRHWERAGWRETTSDTVVDGSDGADGGRRRLGASGELEKGTGMPRMVQRISREVEGASEANAKSSHG